MIPWVQPLGMVTERDRFIVSMAHHKVTIKHRRRERTTMEKSMDTQPYMQCFVVGPVLPALILLYYTIPVPVHTIKQRCMHLFCARAILAVWI